MLEGVPPTLTFDSTGLPSSWQTRYLHIGPAKGLRELMDRAPAARPPAFVVATGGKARAYAVGSTRPLLAALDRCTDDLVRSWGLDPVEQRAATPPEAVTSISDWLTASDYPGKAVANDKSGGVNVRLDVDATGRVTDCHVLEAGGDPIFQGQSCKFLRERARYRPARNAAGAPIASYAILWAIWSVSPRR